MSLNRKTKAQRGSQKPMRKTFPHKETSEETCTQADYDPKQKSTIQQKDWPRKRSLVQTAVHSRKTDRESEKQKTNRKSRCLRDPYFPLISDCNLISNEFVRTYWASAIASASNVQGKLESLEVWIACICKSRHPLINAMLRKYRFHRNLCFIIISMSWQGIIFSQ